MKNRLLVLTTTFPRWKNDNVPPFVFDLSKELNKGIDKVIVLAPHYPGAKEIEILDGLKVYRFPYFYPKRYQKLCYEGGILPNLKRSFLAKIQLPFFFLFELLHTFKIIRKERITVVNSHWMMSQGLVVSIIKKFYRCNHILTIHAADLFGLYKFPFSLFKKSIATFIARNTDFIICVSSYNKEIFLDLIPKKLRKEVNEKIGVLPMGAHTKTFSKLKDKKRLKLKRGFKDKFVLLFIGRLAEKKGVEYLIQAMPAIIKENKDIVLLILGDGPLETELKKGVKSLGLDHNIKFLGFIAGDLRIDYFKLADILIVPSIVTKEGDTEGVPVVILEGLAAGNAIIASDVGGASDVIKNNENGFLIEQKNVGMLSQKVLELVKNPNLIKKFSDNSLRRSKDYDWGVIGKYYIKKIKELK